MNTLEIKRTHTPTPEMIRRHEEHKRLWPGHEVPLGVVETGNLLKEAPAIMAHAVKQGWIWFSGDRNGGQI